MNCLRKKFKKDKAWKDVDEDDNNVAKSHSDCELESSSSDQDSDNEAYAGDLKTKKFRLADKNLVYNQVANINSATAAENTPIVRTKFNPKHRLTLVASQKGNVDLFEVDGERNKYIQRVRVPKGSFPNANFNSDGTNIIFASASYRGNFYSYNIESKDYKMYSIKIGTEIREFDKFTINEKYMACVNQNSSEVCVLSSKTFELLATIKLNERATYVRFDSKDNMYVLGYDGHVYIWDSRQFSKCKHRFTDEGCVHSTSFAISEPSNLLSTGSNSGIVNMYQLDECLKQKFPQPFKTIGNVKNPVHVLEYNRTGELLLAGSSSEDNNFKLIHNSGTVYRNFPQFGKSFGRIRDADFSPLSGYMVIGCSTGKAPLFRLPFYKSY